MIKQHLSIKKGFTLVEILIAMAIASFVIGLLFNGIFQANNMMKKNDSRIDMTQRAALVLHQFQKDIMGSFVPLEAQPKEKKAETTDSKSTTTASNPSQQPKKTPSKKKKDTKPLTKIFYGTTKNKNLDLLTFITNNILEIYWSDRAGKARPKIARVVYRLVKDKNEKDSYTLLRQESSKLDFDAFKLDTTKKIRAYELISGIKELSVQYMVQEEKKEDKEKASQNEEPSEDKTNKQQEPKKFKTSKIWDLEKEKKEDKEDKPEKRKVPNYVLIKIVLWDDVKESTETFNTTIPILPDFSPIIPEPDTMDSKSTQTNEKITTSQPNNQQQGEQNLQGELTNLLSLLKKDTKETTA